MLLLSPKNWQGRLPFAPASKGQIPIYSAKRSIRANTGHIEWRGIILKISYKIEILFFNIKAMLIFR
ncbi:hypothetical protein [Mucilaginibacter arboris]|uniref:Uncharacterized protein n=1 Tax=Mucilaginibacter arboris TaxID=2682090 RepID=A0A7K1SVW1_9SPHI|nr:hypothetical protein [Mucilaginibacter arboris]MVN21377.1 hypothetical protein [Mucilaginibacter arboris]